MAGETPENTELQILYPYVGDVSRAPLIQKTTFNGMRLTAVPVGIRKDAFKNFE